MLSEEEFNDIKDKTYEDYLLLSRRTNCEASNEILIDLVIKYSKGANGNWNDYRTCIIEIVFLKLKEKYISLDNIFKLIEERNNGLCINEGWLSPGFMMLFE